MALYKKKPDPEGTVRITGKELDKTYEADPEGRFEISTAWGLKEITKSTGWGWYQVSPGKHGYYTKTEIEELPEIIYTHSAFLNNL